MQGIRQDADRSRQSRHRTATDAMVAAIVMAACVSVVGQGLPTSVVEQAIKLGSDGKSFDLVLRPSDFVITIRGPIARIARAARDARMEFRPFTIGDVTDEMTSEVVTFTALPAAPSVSSHGVVMTPLAAGIVLVARGGRDPNRGVKPLRSDRIPIDWGSVSSVKLSGQGVIAYFTRDMFPARQFDVLITLESSGEPPRRASVKSVDSFRIR
jgi:hypothetical protein